MISFFIKGFYFGLFASIPIGPIAMICIRNTLVYGWRYGFCAGLGAACADAIYGALAAAGISAIILSFPMVSLAVKYLGALFLLYLGIGFLRKKAVDSKAAAEARTSKLKLFHSTMFLTLANPKTIASFAAMFSACGLAEASGIHNSSLMVLGVFFGSAMWSLILTFSLGLARNCFSTAHLSLMNKFSGAMILLFAVWSLFPAN